MTSPLNLRASSTASALLPEEVGPTITRIFGFCTALLRRCRVIAMEGKKVIQFVADVRNTKRNTHQCAEDSCVTKNVQYHSCFCSVGPIRMKSMRRLMEVY